MRVDRSQVRSEVRVLLLFWCSHNLVETDCGWSSFETRCGGVRGIMEERTLEQARRMDVWVYVPRTGSSDRTTIYPTRTSFVPTKSNVRISSFGNNGER